MNDSYFIYCLKRIFSKTSEVVIHSQNIGWKTGKTDFALLIAQLLLKLGLIDEVATNIFTNGKFKYIHDFISLKQWLYYSKTKKLFILDEANVHFTKRRAMSSKNVSAIMIMPELSKARARVIIIGQDVSQSDSEFLNPTWCKGVFEKISLTKVRLTSPFLDDSYEFEGIPRTSIPFDPYKIAPFTESPDMKFISADPDFVKLKEWVDAEKGVKVFPNTVVAHRFLKNAVKRLLEYKLTPSVENDATPQQYSESGSSPIDSVAQTS